MLTSLPRQKLSRERTEESHAFEAAWRAARGDALVPDHEKLVLRHFKSMLSDMLLIEFFPSEPARSNIRVVGEEIRARIQRNIAGQSHFDFMPESRRLDAARTMRAVITQPSGFWQISGAHYERGYTRCHEMTILPLWHKEHAPLLLVRVVPCTGQTYQIPQNVAVVSLEAPRTCAFLDIGAGIPEEPPSAEVAPISLDRGCVAAADDQ